MTKLGVSEIRRGVAGILAGMAFAAMMLPGSGRAADPVNIGVLFGLTGTAAVSCLESLNSVKLAVSEINKAGGVLGRQINLIVEDDEGRPNAAIQAANKLADIDKVPVVIGGYQSSTALPAGKVFNNKNVVFVVDATTNDLQSVGPYLFDVAGLADQAAALIDFVKADNPNGKRIAGLFENNPIGQDRSKVSEARAKQLGLEYPYAMLYTEGQKDFRAELTKLMAGSLDAKLTEGMKGIDYATSGLRSSDFKKRYTAAYGKSYTDAWAPPFYDAAWIVAIAINLANSLEPQKIRNAMWPAAFVYQGISSNGDKAFNVYGKQPTDSTYPLVYKQGKTQSYSVPGTGGGLIVFRYADERGEARPVAPTEEEFKKLYPNN